MISSCDWILPFTTEWILDTNSRWWAFRNRKPNRLKWLSADYLPFFVYLQQRWCFSCKNDVQSACNVYFQVFIEVNVLSLVWTLVVLYWHDKGLLLILFILCSRVSHLWEPLFWSKPPISEQRGVSQSTAARWTASEPTGRRWRLNGPASWRSENGNPEWEEAKEQMKLLLVIIHGVWHAAALHLTFISHLL